MSLSTPLRAPRHRAKIEWYRAQVDQFVTRPQGRHEADRRTIVLRDSSRHLVVGSALAFVGSVLAGTVVGLPAALAQSGLGQPAEPQTRLTGTLTLQDVALAAQPVVAGDAALTINGLTQGTSIRTAAVMPGTAPGAGVGGAQPGTGQTTPDPSASGTLGIPAPMLDAYKKAADLKNRQTPSCQIDWSLLAAVGKVESDHAAGGKVDAAGRTRGDIIGPQTPYGTAKGPMQFLDSSWRIYGADGNGDGVKDVHNIYDATLGAANHLCGSAGNKSLQNQENLRKGIFGYNRADWYVTKVINWMNQYSGRAVPVPPSEGVITPRPTTPVTPAPVAEQTVQNPAPTTRTPETKAPTGTPAPAPTQTPTPTPTKPSATPTDSGQSTFGGLKGGAATTAPEATTQATSSGSPTE